jgi:hypothetical protein
VGTFKKGSTISLQAAVHLGHMPWALTKEEEEEESFNKQPLIHLLIVKISLKN